MIISSFLYSDEENFDVIIVSSFLHRPTFQSLIQSLKSNGILYYQTLIKVFKIHPTYINKINKILNDEQLYRSLSFYIMLQDKTNPEMGPSNPKFLLDKNELLHLCKDLEILVYREEGTTGRIDQGWRNKAMIVAKKVA